jgi:hypothetical protein
MSFDTTHAGMIRRSNYLMRHNFLSCEDCGQQLRHLPGDVVSHVCPIGFDSFVGREDVA